MHAPISSDTQEPYEPWYKYGVAFLSLEMVNRYRRERLFALHDVPRHRWFPRKALTHDRDRRTPMTPEQIHLVQSSFEKVVPIADDAAACSMGGCSKSRPRFARCSKATWQTRAAN